MADFRNVSALGIEIRHCRAQGADFRGASFMNMITTRTWFCSAYITNTNLSYANFSKAVLEKCELWENRWMGTQVLGATLSGSDLSGGEFSSFDWRTANFTHCDLTNSELGDLDIRGVDLQGVKLDSYQAALLMERAWHRCHWLTAYAFYHRVETITDYTKAHILRLVYCGSDGS